MKEVYYSASPYGTSNLLSGAETSTITISGGLGAATLSLNGNTLASDNIGEGVKVVCAAGTYYISAITSSTTFSLVTNTGTIAGNVTDSEVTSISYVYSSLKAALQGFTSILGSSNLVSGDGYVVNIAPYYDSADFTVDSTKVEDIVAHTSNGTYYVNVDVPNGGTRSIYNNRGNGKFLNPRKYLLQTNTDIEGAIVLSCPTPGSADNVHFTGLQINNLYNASTVHTVYIPVAEPTTGTVFDKCFFKIEDQVSAYGIHIREEVIFTVKNSIFSGDNDGSGIRVYGLSAGFTINIYNCTFLNLDYGVIGDLSDDVIVINCAFFDCIYANTDCTLDYCATATGAEGTNEVTLDDTNNYVNEVKDSVYGNLMPVASSVMLNNGTDLSSVGVTDDFNGNVRDGSTPTIGAFEFSQTALSPDFQKYKTHTINGGTAGSQKNYHMHLILHRTTGTDGSPSNKDVYLPDAAEDFRDVRVSNSDGSIQFDFSIKNLTGTGDSAVADAFIVMPVTPANAASDTIRVYWNNYNVGGEVRLGLMSQPLYGPVLNPDGSTFTSGFADRMQIFAPDAVGILGDYAIIIPDDAEYYDDYTNDVQDVFKNINADRFYAMGMNDCVYKSDADFKTILEYDTGSKVSEYETDKMYGSFNIGEDYLGVVLDTSYDVSGDHLGPGATFTDPADDRYIGTEQLNWLKDVLSSTDKKVLIFSNCSLAPINYQTNLGPYGTYGGFVEAGSSIVQDADDVRAAIENAENVVCCFYGNRSRYRHTTIKGVAYVGVPTIITNGFYLTSNDKGCWLEIVVNDLNKTIRLDYYEDDTTASNAGVKLTDSLNFTFDDANGKPSNPYVTFANGYLAEDGISDYSEGDVSNFEYLDAYGTTVAENVANNGFYSAVNIDTNDTDPLTDVVRSISPQTGKFEAHFSMSHGETNQIHLWQLIESGGGQGPTMEANASGDLLLYDVTTPVDTLINYTTDVFDRYKLDVDVVAEEYTVDVNDGDYESSALDFFVAGVSQIDQFRIRVYLPSAVRSSAIRDFFIVPYVDNGPTNGGWADGTWIALNREINHSKIFQRNGSEGTIAYSGTSSNITNIEWRWNSTDDEDFQDATGSSTFTASSLFDTDDFDTPQGMLTIRDKDNPTTTVRHLYNIGIGDNFLLIGQSNQTGQYEIRFDTSEYTGSLVAGLYRIDPGPFEISRIEPYQSWGPLQDPIDNRWGDLRGQTAGRGSIWPLVAAKIMTETGYPVGIIQGATGASTVVGESIFFGADNPDPSDPDWQQLSYIYETCVSVYEDAEPGGLTAISWYGGESDAYRDVTDSDFSDGLEALRSSLATDLSITNVEMVVGQIGNISGFVPDDSKVDEIRKGTIDAVDTYPYIHMGPNMHDILLTSDDMLHYRYEEEAEVFAERWAQVLKRLYYGSGENRGYNISYVYRSGAEEITIIFTDGNGALQDFNEADTKAAFVYSDSGMTVSTITSPTNNSIVLTMSGAVTVGETISFAEGFDGEGITFRDNSAAVDFAGTDNGIPIEPFYEETIAYIDTDLLDGKIQILDDNVDLLNGEVYIFSKLTDLLDGKIQILDDDTDLLDGKLVLGNIDTDLLDGKIQILDDDVDLLDGKIQILDDDIDLLDGKIQILDDDTDLLDGKVQVKNKTTDNLDGKVQVLDDDIDLLDGKTKIKNKSIDLLDGKVEVFSGTADLLDGKIQILDDATDLLDGKIVLGTIDTDLLDGKVKVKNKSTDNLDGKIQLSNDNTDLLDGKLVLGNIDTDNLDGKVRIKSKDTDSLDGLLQILNDNTNLFDGKIQISNITTKLFDGRVKVSTATTDTDLLDGKIQILNDDIDLLDGKIQISNVSTNLLDGKIILRLATPSTDNLDGKIQILDDDTDLLDGKIQILDDDTDLFDAKIIILNDDTDLFDGKIKIILKDTDLLDGKIIVSDTIDTDLFDAKIVIANATTDLLDGKIVLTTLSGLMVVTFTSDIPMRVTFTTT